MSRRANANPAIVPARGGTEEDGRTARALLVLTAYACMFVFGVVLLLMGSLLPSLELNYARAGNLGSFPLVGILTATVLVGPLLDTLGAKLALVTALVLVAMALAVMPWLTSYPGLAGAALTYGFGGGLLNTATNMLVSDLSAAGRGAALNLLGFSFSLGAISAPLLMSSLGGGFRPSTTLRLLAVLAVLVLLPVLGLRFPPPAQAHTPLTSLLRVLKQPLVWLFGLLLFFESGSENCMFVWSGKVTADLLHVAPERANLALVSLTSALGAGRLLAVLWLRWLSGRSLILLSAVAAALGAGVVYGKIGLAAMLVGFVVLGLGMAAIFPTALGLAGDRFAETGTVFGAIMTLALVGGTAGPRVGAWLASEGPARVLYLPLVAAALIAVLVGTMIGPTRDQRALERAG